MRNKFISSHSSVSKFAPPACIIIRTCFIDIIAVSKFALFKLYHILQFRGLYHFMHLPHITSTVYVCIILCTTMISVSFFQPVSFSAHPDWLYRFLHFFMLEKRFCIKKRTTSCTVICTLICIILCSNDHYINLCILFLFVLYHFSHRLYHISILLTVSFFAPPVSYFDTTHCTVFCTACIIF